MTAPVTVDPLFDPAVVEDPHAYYAQLRETDPVHRIDGTDAYLVTRLDLIHQVVGDPALYSSRTSEFLGLLEQISGFVPEDRRAVLLDKMMELGAVIDGFAAARLSESPDPETLVGVCATAVRNGDLDEMEALGILGLILSAGGESTTSLLGTGVRILAQDAALQDRLRLALARGCPTAVIRRAWEAARRSDRSTAASQPRG